MESNSQWGITFLTTFGNPPTMKESEEYFIIYFNEDVQFCSELHELGYGVECLVDHNLFCVMGSYFQTREDNWFRKQIHLFMARCYRCRVTRPNYYFLNNSSCSMSPLWATCRSVGSITPTMTEIMAVFDSGIIEANEERAHLEKLMSFYKFNLNLALGLDIPIEILVVEHHNGDGTTTLNFNDLMKAVHDHGPYKYISNGTQHNSKRFICSQLKRRGGQSALKRRLRTGKRVFNCKGYVSCSKLKYRTLIRLKHEQQNSEHEEPIRLLEEDHEKIASLCAHVMAPYQILCQIRTNSLNPVLYQDVYNAWAVIMSSKYKRHENPQTSSMLYINECETLHQLGFQSNPFGLAIYKTVGEEIMKEWRVEEVLIDSTFKTNREKLELFVLIGSCMGAGFPLCSFLLEAGTGLGLKSREESLTFFLQLFKTKFPNSRPSFSFTDKEVSQIKALRSVFEADPSLYLWHMKRSIKTNLKELRKEKLSTISDQEENEFDELINAHYFRSTVTTNISSEHLREIALNEMNSYFNARNEEGFKEYIYKNWYDEATWRLWGGRHPTMIPFSRTTMKVESHWSIVERIFLLRYNRPRLDLLVHILSTSVMQKFKHDYDFLKIGRKNPFWWKSFVHTWKKCSNATVHCQYQTDFENFICSCPAWLRSQYFICKHLVQNTNCPKYGVLTIRRSPPFIIINLGSTETKANIDNEKIIRIEEDVINTPILNLTTPNPPSTDSEIMTRSESEVQTPSAHVQFDTIKQEVSDIMSWFSDHLHELAAHDASSKQLKYVNSHILRRIRTYRENVQRLL